MSMMLSCSHGDENYLEDVDEILQVLSDIRVSLKFEKGALLTDIVRYSRNIIDPERLEFDETHVKALAKAEATRSLR